MRTLLLCVAILLLASCSPSLKAPVAKGAEWSAARCELKDHFEEQPRGLDRVAKSRNLLSVSAWMLMALCRSCDEIASFTCQLLRLREPIATVPLLQFACKYLSLYPPHGACAIMRVPVEQMRV